MKVVRIDSAADPLIADYRNVPDPELIARRGLFVAEGRLVVQRLLTSDRWTTRSALVTETALSAIRAALERHPALPVYVADQSVMNTITGYNIHRGCLALGERRPLPGWRNIAGGAKVMVVLEALGNVDNVGSIFRHAAAFGADAVLLGPACADPLYRKAVRTSMAAVLAVPFANAEPWPDALAELRDLGHAVVALTPRAPTTLRDMTGMAANRPLAIVVGHEGEGLTAEALSVCEYQARIPIAARVDSLNAATAAAIALYEFSR